MLLEIKKMYFYVLVALFVVAVGFLSAFNPKLSFVLCFLLGVSILSFIKWKSTFIFWLTLFLIIPYGQYKFFKLEFMGVDIFLFLFLILFSALIITNSIKRLGISFYLLVLFIFLYALVSIHKPYFFTELKIYMYFILFPMFIFLFKKQKDGLDLFIKISTVSSIWLSVFTIIIFFYKSSIFYSFFAGTFYENGSRVAISNTSIFLITAPVIVFSLMNRLQNNRWKLFNLIAIPLIMFSALIGESRTLIGGLIFNIILIVLYSLLFNKKRIGINLSFIILSFCVLSTVFVIGFSYFSFGHLFNTIFERFNEFFQSGNVNSLEVRSNSNQYALGLIKQNLLGYGIGSSMLLIDFNGNIYSKGFFIDNGFITILYKFGVIGLLLFITFYFTNIINICRVYMKEKKEIKGKFALAIMLCMPLFITSSLYLSAQLVMNGVIFTYTMMVFAYFFVEINKQIRNKQ